jgi:hypothetical protein
MYAFSWHLVIRFHVFPSCKQIFFFWGKFLVLRIERVPFLGKILVLSNGTSAFLGVSSNRGQTLKIEFFSKKGTFGRKKGTFGQKKGTFGREWVCTPTPPGSAHVYICKVSSIKLGMSQIPHEPFGAGAGLTNAFFSLALTWVLQSCAIISWTMQEINTNF